LLQSATHETRAHERYKGDVTKKHFSWNPTTGKGLDLQMNWHREHPTSPIVAHRLNNVFLPSFLASPVSRRNCNILMTEPKRRDSWFVPTTKKHPSRYLISYLNRDLEKQALGRNCFSPHLNQSSRAMDLGSHR
jgi:hypothetical protein